MFKLSGAILVVFAPGFPIIRVRSLYVDRRRSSETIYLWLVILNNERWKQMSRNWISLSCNKDARRDYLTGEILGSAVCCHGTQWEVWLFDNLTFWLFLTISLFFDYLAIFDFLTIWLFLTISLFLTGEICVLPWDWVGGLTRRANIETGFQYKFIHQTTQNKFEGRVGENYPSVCFVLVCTGGPMFLVNQWCLKLR